MLRYTAIVLLLLLSPTRAQEVLTTTSPQFVESGVTTFRVASIYFDWQHAQIDVTVKPFVSGAFVEDRRVFLAHYTGQAASDLMIILNKANLSTQSLHQRVITKLKADGYLPPGTTTGTVP